MPEASPLTALRQKPLLSWLAVLTALFHIYANMIGTLPTLWQNGLHFGLFALMAFLTVPFREGARWRKIDVAAGVLIFVATLAALIGEDAIYQRGVRLSGLDWVVSLTLIAAALELTRRLTGKVIPVLIILALTYVGFWGGWLSGVFRFEGLSWETLIFRSIYGDDALFGTIASISATYVFMFILFGAFLLKSGAGDFIVDLARAIAGRFVGGPGIVAVFASALTGTISGSAVANTVSTGVITIPLMKRSGFRPEFAAGVEAAASTGGQLMPPIMGAGAFVMAATTGIPYGTIALMAILPALLYFASVTFFVRIEARRVHAEAPVGEAADPGPNLRDVMREGGLVFLVPIVVLIGVLIAGFTPTYAASAGILAAIGASWLTKSHRMGLEQIFDALELGARNMVMTAVLLCAVGLIVNVIATTGLGPTFSLMISEWAGGNLMIALVLIALASLVLGMGLPVTAAYIVLGTLSAPALYHMILEAQLVEMLVSGEVGESVKMFFVMGAPQSAGLLDSAMSKVDALALVQTLPPELLMLINDQAFSPAALTAALLSAHMIIFWLSQDSNVTPPVCLAAFSAAAVAKADPMRTGFAAWRIAKGLYVVPVLMAYTPLMSGDLAAMAEVTLFALFGLWALTSALEGYAKGPIGWPFRAVFLALGVGLLCPLGVVVHTGLTVVLIAANQLSGRLELAKAT